jgi:hypothetical protein
MRVYHGSYLIIENIDLTKCQPNKDFGKGFYVTKFYPHAKNWAQIIGEKHQTTGVITEFDFCDSDFSLSICKVKRFEKYDEEWLDFVVLNRDKKSAFAHDYDIVEGPVANDKIQNRLKKYLRGNISKTAFLEELKYHEETHQICFCTLNSLQTLDLVGKTPRKDITGISEPLMESLISDFNLSTEIATDQFFTSKTFTQLADENTGLYLKTWQEIYELLKIELSNKKQ